MRNIHRVFIAGAVSVRGYGIFRLRIFEQHDEKINLGRKENE